MPDTTSSSEAPAPLRATADDVSDWRALATCLEAEARVHYEAFLFDRQRRVDDAVWAPMGPTDTASLRLFRERESHGHAPLGPQAALAARGGATGRRVLLVGVVAGSVDDALFGCSVHDTATLRTREAYNKSLGDCAVLAAVDGPTLKDPFRFLGVAWHARSEREWLLLERTHSTTLSTGDRVGVNLRHTIDHRDVQASSGDRAVFSSATFFREVDAQRIEVFSVKLRDGHFPHDSHERLDAMAAPSRACATGFEKKLVWFLEQQMKRYHPAAALPPSDSKCCTLCRAGTDGMLLRTGAACVLCAKHVCSSCYETHEIVMDASEPELEMDAFAFCVECLAKVARLPTQRIAREQVVHLREQPQ